MRRLVLAAPLALVLLTPLALLAGGQLKFAKLYLSGDRIVEGEVLAEDDETITIKTDLAEAPFPKKEVLYALRTDVTSDELKARKHARSVYTSLLLGYKLTKPEDWTFKFDPPEPLSDVLVRFPKDQVEISVFGVPDQHPDVAFDDEALKNLTATSEAKLKEKFIEVKRTASEKTKFKDQPAFFLEFSMQRKESKKEFKEGEIIFRNKGKVLFFSVWAPAARYDKAKATFDEVLASIEFTEANPQEGDRLFSQDSLFVLEKPQDWTFGKGAEILSPKGEASFRVDPRKVDEGQSLDAFSKDVEPDVAAKLSSPKKTTDGSANVCGRLGHQWVYEYEDGGKKRRRLCYALKDQNRGYVLTADYPLDKAAFAPITGEIVGRFRILNSLLAAGALEKGLEAIHAYDEGDKKLAAKDPQNAIALYEQAVASYPRYANAWNNMGIAYLQLKDIEKARRSFQRAYDFFPEDPLIRGNLAIGQIGQALDLLGEKKGEEAQRLIERARSMIPPDSAPAKDMLAQAYNGLGIYHADKESWSAAAASLEKALALKPKDPQLTKNMASICVGAAIAAYNKRNESSATTWANKALSFDPGNSKAREVLDLIKKNKKK